ncbi:MAG: hypothetical protein AMXMBFR53_25070 [Gemmatimonadota bacterium]
MSADVNLLILDLDHTLFDPETIPRGVMEPAFDRVREAHRQVGGLSREALEASIAELMGAPISLVAAKYGWPDSVRQVCLEATAEATLPSALPVYPDVAAIVDLPCRKVLVTTGVPAVQWQKVEATGVGAWLDGVHVDDVLAVPRRGKKAVFGTVLAEEGVARETAVVVGDRLESEIAAGNALGLRTVHVARNGCDAACPATYCVPDLEAMVLRLWKRGGAR